MAPWPSRGNGRPGLSSAEERGAALPAAELVYRRRVGAHLAITLRPFRSVGFPPARASTSVHPFGHTMQRSRNAQYGQELRLHPHRQHDRQLLEGARRQLPGGVPQQRRVLFVQRRHGLILRDDRKVRVEVGVRDLVEDGGEIRRSNECRPVIVGAEFMRDLMRLREDHPKFEGRFQPSSSSSSAQPPKAVNPTDVSCSLRNRRIHRPHVRCGEAWSNARGVRNYSPDTAFPHP